MDSCKVLVVLNPHPKLNGVIIFSFKDKNSLGLEGPLCSCVMVTNPINESKVGGSDLYLNTLQENKNSDNRNENTSVNILGGLALSYSREKPGTTRRIAFLSYIAQQYLNKEIKLFFKYTNTCSTGEEVSCSDYEITKARLHSRVYGPGAPVPKTVRACTTIQ